MCEALIKEILFPSVACCVCVFSGVILGLRLWLIYQKQEDRVVNRKGSYYLGQTR